MGGLSLCRGAVSVFYSPSRLGKALSGKVSIYLATWTEHLKRVKSFTKSDPATDYSFTNYIYIYIYIYINKPAIKSAAKEFFV